MTSNQSPELGDSATNYQHRVEEQKSLARQREEILAQQEYDEEEDRMYSEMITEVKQANGRGGPDSTTASSVSNLDEITPVKADQINVLNDENTDPNLVEQRTVSFHSEKSSRNEKSTKYEKITNNQENNVDVYSEKSSSEKITRESENGQISEEMVRLERTRQQLETLGIQLDPLTGNVVMPNRHVSRLKGPSPDFMQAFPAQNNLSMHANAIAMKYNSDQQINQKLAEGQGKGANVQQKVQFSEPPLQTRQSHLNTHTRPTTNFNNSPDMSLATQEYMKRYGLIESQQENKRKNNNTDDSTPNNNILTDIGDLKNQKKLK